MRRLLGKLRLWPVMVVITSVLGIALAFNGVPQALVIPAWVAIYGVFRRARNADHRTVQRPVSRDPEALKPTMALRSVRRHVW